MEEKLNNIRVEVDKALKDNEIFVTDVSYHKEGKYNFLTIELDKVTGIDLDEIVLATNIINPIIDGFDYIDDTYILDVISKERGN
jgi:ribosome maturation factor RimP